MTKRNIIKIDEDRCNGCGECVPNCAEGALQIIDGKARLVSDVLCDGLGACLGHCPQDAITIEGREAEAFDEKEVHIHQHAQGSCPGSKVMDFSKKNPVSGKPKAQEASSQLGNWPLQIMLVPKNAPYLNGANLLIAADCVPFAYAGFHENLLAGKVCIIGCPKLDDSKFYTEKLSEIFKGNDIKSITCAHMEVPCCLGFINIIENALASSGKKIPFKKVNVGIKGDIL